MTPSNCVHPEITAPSPLEGFVELIIEPRYLNLVRNGTKVVEARLKRPAYAKMKEKQIIRLIHDNDRTNWVEVEILYLHTYPKFREMLIHEGIDKCFPDLPSLDEAETLYLNFPRYRELEDELGVLAIGIKLVRSS